MKLTVIVKPNSKKNEVIPQGDTLIVKVKERPEKGRANLAVEKILSKYFGRQVRIVAGHKSRKKIVEIEKNI